MTTNRTLARPAINLRHKDLTPLSDTELRKFAPAIFTEMPRSDFQKRGVYQHVATYEILAAMRSEGFQPVEASTYWRRDTKRIPYAMHMLRFAEVARGHVIREVGDVAPQIVLRNRHDGSSPFEIWSGLFRKICANGLIVSDSEIVAPIRVRHTARVVYEAMYAVAEIADRQKLVLEHIDAMREIKLSKPQQIELASRAIALRPNVQNVIRAEALLAARRTQDNGDDLWRVFNRVQENLMQGGMEGETANKHRTTVRSVSSIGATLDINAHLWTLAMQAIAKAAGSSKAAVEAAKPTAAAKTFGDILAAGKQKRGGEVVSVQ